MKHIAHLPTQERQALFNETATAMGITAAAVEKDFWICWVLLHIFEDDFLRAHLRFKGGTSLSKCYQAIERFSEDIDLVLDWTSLHQQSQQISFEAHADNQRSKTQQTKLNRALNANAQAFIVQELLPRFIRLMGDICHVSLDAEDAHTVNITYPKAFTSDYLRPQVRLEIGPLAAMLPMEIGYVQPYAAHYFPQLFAQASIAVPTITLARTFWEKLTILHAQAHRPRHTPLPSRYARHYYDVYQLVHSGLYQQAMQQYDLLADVVAFKTTFYPSAWAQYHRATLSGLVLQPSSYHNTLLRNDYQAMQDMLFGDKPTFETIVETLIQLEHEVHSLQ